MEHFAPPRVNGVLRNSINPQNDGTLTFETAAHCRRRVDEFKDWIEARPERFIVVVGHSSFFKMLCGDTFKMPNCGVREMDRYFRHDTAIGVSVDAAGQSLGKTDTGTEGTVGVSVKTDTGTEGTEEVESVRRELEMVRPALQVGDGVRGTGGGDGDVGGGGSGEAKVAKV